MKRIFALFLAIVMLAAFCPAVYAETAVDYVTDKVTVVARGNAGASYAGKRVALLLLKDDVTPAMISSPSDILGIDETKVSKDGTYEFEAGLNDINFNENISNGHLFIKVGNDDITDTLISAHTETTKQFFAQMKIKAEQGGRIAYLSVRAPQNYIGEAFFAVAQFDENNKLISVERPTVEIKNGGAEAYASLVPQENAKYCKAFGWYKNMAPIGDSVVAEKTPQKVLIVGNSFSVDSARYVHQIAESLGINLDVYVYQIGGATAEFLYNEREKAESYVGSSKNGWYAAKNGEGISTNLSLDDYLNENTFDAVVLQNYWGTSDGIQFYSENEATADYEGLPSPHYVNLARYIKEKQPNAQIMINAIWSNEEGGPMGSYVKNNYARNGFENAGAFMYDLIEKYNGQSAVDIGAATTENGKTIGIGGGAVKQLPVGYAIQFARGWADGSGNRKFQTVHDPSIYAQWEVGSEHAFPEVEGKIRLNRDGYHLSQTGRYLAGCVWVEALTGVDVRSATYLPGEEKVRAGVVTNQTVTNEIATIIFSGISAEDGVLLREIAHSAVEKFYSQNVRTLSLPSLGF